MKPADIFIVAILTISAEYIHGQSIITPPADATGLLGKTASFHCEVIFGPIEEITWEFNGKSVYSMLDGVEKYPEGTNKYTVIRTGETFTLNIKDLGLLDGGEYTCTSLLATATAVLTVLGIPSISSDPNDPVEGETVKYKCEAGFGGLSDESPGHLPKLQMFLDDIPLSELLPESKLIYKTAIRNLTMTFDLNVDAGHHDQQLKCEVGTTPSGMKSTTSTDLNVMYPVRDIVFTPHRSEYEVGSQLTCTADGNPPPSYKWRNTIDNGIEVGGRWLNITKDMLGPNQWECAASNFIREKAHENNILAIFEALDSATDENSDSGIIIAVVVILIIITGALGIVLFIFREKVLNYLRNWTQGDALEHIECEEGANESLMQGKDTQKYADTIKNLQRKEELDNHGQSILNSLKEDGKAIFECDPDILLVMTQKASILIESKDYINIIKEMATSYNTVSHTPECCPLQCLNQQMLNPEKCEVLKKHQHQFLSLIQAVNMSDVEAQSRTECLGNLISLSKYVSESEVKFEWSEELFATLKLLLEKGADPNWISRDGFSTERKIILSAQYKLFWAIYYIICQSETSFIPIMDILPLFRTKKSTTVENQRGSILHALMEHEWKDFQKLSPPPTFFQHYHTVLSEVLENDPSLIENRDFFDRTPLHVSMDMLYLPVAFLEDCKKCALLLKSNDNINAKDKNGQTVLHYVANVFPSLPGIDSKVEKNTFLDLVRNLASDSNICIQDMNRQTALHVLAKSNEKVSNQGMLIDLMKIFQDASNIPDNHGRTALHIMAEKYNGLLTDDCKNVFLEILKLFFNDSNCNIQDKNGCTVSHIIGGKFEEIQQNDQRDFMKVMTFLSGYPSASIQDNEGRTILHIMGNCYNSSMPLSNQEKVCEILKMFTSASNINIQDQWGQTTLHLLAHKYPTDILHEGFDSFLEVVKCLAQYNCLGVKDMQGSTALHVIVEKFNKDLPEYCLGIFNQFLETTINSDNVDIKDSEGRTILHIMAEKFPCEVTQLAIEAFLAAIKNIVNFSNTGTQDKMGCTAMHIIVENYNQDISEHCKNNFSDLVKMLKPEAINNIQDKRGRTVLHIIGQTICHATKISDDFLPILPDLISSQNVNALDADSMTPYSWILKAQSDNKDPKIKKTLSKIQKVFTKNGADSLFAKQHYRVSTKN